MTKKHRDPLQTRVNEILSIIHANPGKDSSGLRTYGVESRDGTILRSMEASGLIEFKGNGWRLTSKGDVRLLEETE